MVADVHLAGSSFGVFFWPTGKPVFSANRIKRLLGVFDSQIVDATSFFLSWWKISWDATLPSGTKVYVYVRSASSESVIKNEDWHGPLLNKDGENVSSQAGRYLQFRIVLFSCYSGNKIETPEIRSLTAACRLSNTLVKFYTKTFNLGFKPKHALLTYNGTIPDDSVVTFAIAGTETTNFSDFQIITPDVITKLDDISEISEGFKVMISAIGSKEVPFIIDEFSVIVSGDGQTQLN
jgi:hypothetical protein